MSMLDLEPVDIEAVNEVLTSGNLSMGERVRNFEFEMAKYLKTEYFVFVNSGSSANLALIESLLRPTLNDSLLNRDDLVALPAICWPTTAWPVIQLGLTPLFIDVDSNHMGMSYEHLARQFEVWGSKIKAVFPINPLGVSLDDEKFLALCETYNSTLIIDNCESLGSWVKDRHGGSHALASTYSFYFSHHITTIEGGGIATNSLELANDLRSIRSHGWSRGRSDEKYLADCNSDIDNRFLFVGTGFNVRPTEISAAIGLRHVPNIDNYVERRRTISYEISRALEGTKLSVIDGSKFTIGDERANSWMLIPIRISDGNSETKRKITHFLNSVGVDTRPPLTGNFMRQPSVRKYVNSHSNPDDFVNADFIERSTFLVGCHHRFSDSQIEYLGQMLRKASSLL
jgi:CDP-4-dehydro-6-deoxyglucose reductase, E1